MAPILESDHISVSWDMMRVLHLTKGSKKWHTEKFRKSFLKYFLTGSLFMIVSWKKVYICYPGRAIEWAKTHLNRSKTEDVGHKKKGNLWTKNGSTSVFPEITFWPQVKIAPLSLLEKKIIVFRRFHFQEFWLAKTTTHGACAVSSLDDLNERSESFNENSF